MPHQRRHYERRYISVAELAERWSVSPSAIYSRKCGTSALTPIRFGRSIRFLRSEVEALERVRHRLADKSKIEEVAEINSGDELAA